MQENYNIHGAWIYEGERGLKGWKRKKKKTWVKSVSVASQGTVM